jgi:hypothetical protein
VQHQFVEQTGLEVPPNGGRSASELSADAGLTVFAYTAEPGSKSAKALSLLGSWAATLEHEQSTAVTGGD